MTIVRRIARPLLAAQFINGGLDQLRRPGSNAAHGGPVIPALAGLNVGPVELPSDPEALVKLNGAIMTGAGSLLALGKLPRLSALVLAGSIVPTTLTGHRFWEREDAEERRHDLHEVLKNVGLLGGLLIAAVDTNGKPGLTWRARRAARDTRRAAKLAAAGGGKLAASGGSKLASAGGGKKAAKSASAQKTAKAVSARKAAKSAARSAAKSAKNS